MYEHGNATPQPLLSSGINEVFGLNKQVEQSQIWKFRSCLEYSAHSGKAAQALPE